MKPATSVTLAIVAGGQGRRLGGTDKGLLRLPDGTLLLRYLLQKLSDDPWQDILIVCRSDQAETYQPLIGTARCVFDRHGPGLGPMAALHAALKSSDSPWVQLWPVDAPVVCPTLLSSLNQASIPALVPVDETGRLQPLFGRYHISLLPALETHLIEQRLALSRWLHDIQAPTLPWPDSRCFTNLNRPGDLNILKEIQ